jgi:LCP family protein required for cell wall assembly
VLPEHPGAFHTAFETGGAACTTATMQKLTGIKINHYVAIDFSGFKNMVDALGTVTVCAPTAVTDPDTGLVLTKGSNGLNGEQALAFVRSDSLGDGTDLGRTKRQQRFLGTVLRQAVGGNLLANPIRFNDFLDAITSSITVDRDTTLGDLRTLLTSLKGLDPGLVTFFSSPIAAKNYQPPGSAQTNLIQLDAAAGPSLYNAVIHDQTQLIRSQAAATATPSAQPSATAKPTAGRTVDVTGAPSSTVTSSAKPLPLPGGGINAADASCVL